MRAMLNSLSVRYLWKIIAIITATIMYLELNTFVMRLTVLSIILRNLLV